jgi:lysozyme
MKSSLNGIKLIKSFEGLELKAYKDTAGVWTIGYGSTRYANGKAVKQGDRLASEAEATALLSATLGEYERALTERCKVPLNQN